MSNPNPKTEHLKATQIPRKRPDHDDHATMIDMIKAGTDVDAFMLFWHQAAGYKLSSLKTMYYEFKSKI